ncbi:MAG: polyprenyl synthetase family protein [Candidatus Eremiobacteraeota bacterium]|nr:polyprenyl synthetase family protein [Candidatus Eremiobacteraeota bacterium]
MIESTQPAAFDAIVEQFVREELAGDNIHIAEAVRSMLEAGGKRLRPRIAMLAGPACCPGAASDPVIASYMELIHVATLIHDDVLDGAQLRRGRASTNHAYGNRFSVLAGDYLFSWVFKKVTQTYASPVPTVLAAMLAEICNGEVKQLRATGDIALSKERYLEIIGKKTAELFAACAECGAIAALQLHCQDVSDPRSAPGVRALRAFGWSFGMAFQIRDDLLDLTADEALLGKPAGSDLREGKMTLPLILALEDRDETLRSLLAQAFAGLEVPSATSGAALARLVQHVRAGPGPERSLERMAAYAAQAQEALNCLAPSAARDELAGLARTLT